MILACDLAVGAKLLSDVGHVDVGQLSGLTDSGLVEWFVQGSDESSVLLGQINVRGACGGDFICDVKTAPKNESK